MASQISTTSGWGETDTPIEEPPLGPVVAKTTENGASVEVDGDQDEGQGDEGQDLDLDEDQDQDVGEDGDQDQDQDQDGVGLTAENMLLQQVFRSLRERRHRGHCDKVRIQKTLVSRKGLWKKRRPPADINGSQGYITPSCTRTPIIIPTVAPETDPTTSSFSTSTRGLLQQLRDIDSGHTPIITPLAGSNSSQSIRGAAKVLVDELLSEGCLWPKPDLLTVGEDGPLDWCSEELNQINGPQSQPQSQSQSQP